MKNDLINKGVDATENKVMTTSDLKTGIIITLILITSILTCVTFTQFSKVSSLEGKLKQYEDLHYQDLGTINELTYDNLQLSK